MTNVSTATAAPRTSPHVSVNRPNPVSVGTIVWLASELMFFAGLFAMYFTLRAAVPDEWATQTEKLNLTFDRYIPVHTSATPQTKADLWKAMGK